MLTVRAEGDFSPALQEYAVKVGAQASFPGMAMNPSKSDPKTRFLLLASTLFAAAVVGVAIFGVYPQTEARRRWCVERGYEADYQSRMVGKLVFDGRVVCLDKDRRVVAVPP